LLDKESKISSKTADFFEWSKFVRLFVWIDKICSSIRIRLLQVWKYKARIFTWNSRWYWYSWSCLIYVETILWIIWFEFCDIKNQKNIFFNFLISFRYFLDQYLYLHLFLKIEIIFYVLTKVQVNLILFYYLLLNILMTHVVFH
jgi:hypothetical protein